MIIEEDKHNIQILLDYFFNKKYQALKVENERLQGYNSPLWVKTLKVSAVIASLILGCFNPWLFLFTPLVVLGAYFQIPNVEPAAICHKSVVKMHLEVLMENSDDSEYVRLQQCVDEEFGPAPEDLVSTLFQETHHELYAQRLQALKDHNPEEEEKLKEKQSRVESVFAPSTYSKMSFIASQTALSLKKSVTSAKKSVTSANAVQAMTAVLGDHAAIGIAAAVEASNSMWQNGVNKADVHKFALGAGVLIGGRMEESLPPEAKYSVKIAEHVDKILSASGSPL